MISRTAHEFNYFRILFSIILIIMILFSGIQGFNASAADEQIKLRCAIKPLKTTNPFNADQEDWKILNLIYEGATKNDPVTGERLPYIAVGSANESKSTFYITWANCVVGNFDYCQKGTWEDPSKPEMILFYDFEDVYWHDGVQMNIRDIMFTFHAASSEQYPWLGHPLTDLAGRLASNYTDDSWLFIEKVWESEDNSRAALKFTLQSPYYSVFDYYLSAPVLPYHIWGNVVGNQLINNTKIWSDSGYDKSDEYSWKQYFAVKFNNLWPIGSGPFRWENSGYDYIYLAPWEKHFYRPEFKYYSNQNKIMEQPQIDILSLKFYDSEERATMDLESNKIDYIAWNLPQIALAEFVNNPNIRMASLRATSMLNMGYNMRRKSFGYTILDQTTTEVDYGKPLRRAMAHCIDTSAINLQVNNYVIDVKPLEIFNEWKNDSAPIYSFDPPEAIYILNNANYVLANPEQPPGEDNWWYNPDGSSIGSSPEGQIQVLALGSEYDSVRFNTCTMLVTQMRNIGLNAELISLSPEDLNFRISQREYDICLIDEDITGIYGNGMENYAFSRFHSYNTISGPNYIGYKNTSMDKIIFSAMDATNLQTRKVLAQDIMGALSYDLPQSNIYSLCHTEIYRYDNFYGMLDDGSGSLLNPSSIASVRMQEKNALKAKFIGLPLTMASNETVRFKVKVIDQHGNAMSGTYVTLESSSGFLLNNTGMTDQFGTFITNFTAPYVPFTEDYNSWELVFVKIKSVTLKDYKEAPEISSSLTVFPDYLRHLDLRATLTQDVIADIDDSGIPGFTYLNIQTRDANNIPLSGVSINIESFGGNITLSDTELKTDQDGQASIRITASNIENSTECMIRINASKNRFFNATQELNISIVDIVEEPEQAKESVFSQMAVPLTISFALVSAIGVLIYIRRRKKQK